MRDEIDRRRTFAIISHPDAGKTTLTEKLLLFGGAIQLAGAVKGRKAARHATSDWMAMEQARGISVTSSVMQFDYLGYVVNLLDTPGHEDFSEDTYRTLTAVDSALMVIDAAKGVEERTEKLMEVCRLRDTPVMTFINKLDREGREPIELLDEVERVLGIRCTPVTWPVGMGRGFRGVYHVWHDTFHLFDSQRRSATVEGLHSPQLDELLGADATHLREELELVLGAGDAFDAGAFATGAVTPVFFGSALNNFGVAQLLDEFVRLAPPPGRRATRTRTVDPHEEQFSGFVFKIQANMDPAHRDRIAFLRICSGAYRKGMRMRHVRLGKEIRVGNALTFLAAERERAEEAYAGDIIGLHNHGTIRIGDTFTEKEDLAFTGVPNFAPELFKRASLRDPLRAKALLKGLRQLCEEGATQLFRPLAGNDLILGAVGVLQFEVVAQRLRDEYGVQCTFEPVPIHTARWVQAEAPALKQLREKSGAQLAEDHAGELVYLAPTRVNLQMTQERHPDVVFHKTREQTGLAA